MIFPRKMIFGSICLLALSPCGCGKSGTVRTPDPPETPAPPEAPAPPESPAPPEAPVEQTAENELTDSDLRELTRMLPDLIDAVRSSQNGDNAKAALSNLEALPLGGDTDVIDRNRDRILWATAVHGLDHVQDTALQARDSEDAAVRESKRLELADLLRIDDVAERSNAVLEKILQGKKPTEQEVAILEVAAEIMQSSSPAQSEP